MEEYNNEVYIDEDGNEVIVINPYRGLAVSLLEAYGIEDMDTEEFEGLVAHLAEDRKRRGAELE